jgi:protein-disulfide isomerase
MIRSVLIAAVLVSCVLAGPVRAAEFNDAQKKEIGELVRDYLLNNPSVIYEAADKHQQNMAEKADAEAKKALTGLQKDLFEGKNYGIIGAKDAKVPFAEFFDYNCGYCKKAYTELVKLTEKNKDIKIILVDTPILGPSSMLAAKWAVAAGTLGKYTEFHAALMNFQGPKSEETLTKLATDVGLDATKVKEIADKPETEAQISKNMEIFQKLGLNGTPAFALPDRVIRGAAGADALDAIAKEYLDKNRPLKK